MDQALFSPYVMLAAATVGKVISKKAVDTLARSSLNGISTALNRRFQGDTEVNVQSPGGFAQVCLLHPLHIHNLYPSAANGTASHHIQPATCRCKH
jgi:hypothetical protein